MSTGNFKVIVVGGGPVGLTAAHALTRANIDFVVLESRPKIVIDAGSDLVLLPMGMRLLGQLDLLGDVEHVSTALEKVVRIDHQGYDLGETKIFNHMKEAHGTLPRTISRHQLTRVMYESLPAESQARMLPGKKVAAMETTDAGVVVRCADGTSYEGTIVIGADGAHSRVRGQMRELALKHPELAISTPKPAEDSATTTTTNNSASTPAPAPATAMAQGEEDDAKPNDELPYESVYRCLWVRFPTATGPGLKAGSAFETHGTGATTQLFAGPETTVIGVYERMAEGPQRERSPRYTPADEAALAARWAHLPLLPAGPCDGGALTLGEAYAARMQSGMVNLEEGVVRRWGWGGRVVLVGDAAHKFTPSTGAGCNNGMIDIVVLLNQLHPAIAESGPSGKPSRERLAAAFAAYQRARFGPVTAGCESAGRATATASWHTWALWAMDRFAMPTATMQNYFMQKASAAIARTPVLSYVDATEKLNGSIPWVQPLRAGTAAA